jgi:P-type Cu2+ transporter
VNASTIALTDMPASATAHVDSPSTDAFAADPFDEQAFARCTRWIDMPAGRLAQSHLSLSGIRCAACAPTIEDALRGVAGVLDARVSAAAARAVVHWDPARARLIDLIGAVQRAGYGATPDGSVTPRAQRLRESRQALWRFFVAAFCAMQVMMFLTPSYVSGPGELDDDMRRLLAWAAWTSTLPVLVFSAAPLFAGAWRSLRHRRMGMDVPVALGLVVTFVASTAAMVNPQGALGGDVYFDSLTMFIAFLLGARWFEVRARHRAAAWLDDAARRVPDVAQRVRDDGTVDTVSSYLLRVGDRVRVPVGESFAADGVLVEGATEVDEGILTGESTPVLKPPGAHVLAGSLNLSRVVDMRVHAAGADTRQASIVALMRDAAMQRPDAVRMADRWATPFLWAVLVLAAGSALVWSVIDPARAAWVAVSVLIVTCPCALSLAVPSAQMATMGFLARHGLLLRRVEALEALARVKLVVFDKTGTLTLGRGDVALEPEGGTDASGDGAVAQHAWRVAQRLASASAHPVSRAIAASARARALRPGDVTVSDIQEVLGQGVAGFDAQGHPWRLGSLAWATSGMVEGAKPDRCATTASNAVLRHAAAPTASPPMAWLADHARARVWRFVGGAQSLRAGAEGLGAALAGAGVDLAIVSGDAAARVEDVARRIGSSTAVANADPESKLATMRAWQGQGIEVAMVGDGINDAPVIAQADVSIAIGEGAAVTRSQADAVLVGNDLSVLPLAVTQARRCTRVMRQNLAWAAAYNLACIPLAMAGLLPPWAAGLGMALSSLVVIANAQRLAR